MNFYQFLNSNIQISTPRCMNALQFRRLSYKSLVSWYSGLIKAKPPESPFNHIVQIGDPTLRTKCEEIPRDLITSPEITFLINRMRRVMKKYNCVGLAAPQVGSPFRLILMEFTQKHWDEYSSQQRRSREMQIIPFKVIINPEIKVTDFTKISFPECCESVKGFEAEVSRFRGIHLSAFDEKNEAFEMEIIGWPARIVQHEIDHLNGKIYTDIMDRQSLACSCWAVINERGGKVELPYGTP